MIDPETLAVSSAMAASLAAGLVGYGKLQQRVSGQDEKFDTLRKDIARLDERIADLTDFLLREHRNGTDPNKVRG